MSTSSEALATVTASGLVTAKQFAVYRLLLSSPGMTGREIDAALHDPDAHKRLDELRKMGVARSAGKRACKVSNLRAHVWEVIPGAEPKPLPPRGATQPSAEKIAAFFVSLPPLAASAHPEVVRWLAKLATE